MTNELKPCPLCGWEAVISGEEYYSSAGECYYTPVVFCTRCGLSLSGEEHNRESKINLDEEITSLKEAWNRRV